MIGKFGDIEILSATANPSTLLDDRGAIFTWLPSEPILEFNLLYFNAGKTRGNHFHPEFTEYFLVIKGSIALFTEDLTNGQAINMLCGEGMLLRSRPGVPHAIHAITDAVCMSLITKPWDQCDSPIVYKGLTSS